MESRDLVSVSRRVSRPDFCSLDLEGFRSRSRALRHETLHSFFMRFFKEFFDETVSKNDCSKFSPVFLKVARIDPKGAILNGKEAKTTQGRWGVEITQRGRKLSTTNRSLN